MQAIGPFAVVTDENVAQAQWPRLKASLEAAGLSAEWIVLPAGDGTKSWGQLEALTDQADRPWRRAAATISLRWAAASSAIWSALPRRW